MSTWWLSFCDPNLPKGSQFLGVVIVEAPPDIACAAVEAWDQQCNPGGEIEGWELPGDVGHLIPASHRNRVLDKVAIAEVEAMVSAGLGPS